MFNDFAWFYFEKAAGGGPVGPPTALAQVKAMFAPTAPLPPQNQLSTRPGDEPTRLIDDEPPGTLPVYQRF